MCPSPPSEGFWALRCRANCMHPRHINIKSNSQKGQIIVLFALMAFLLVAAAILAANIGIYAHAKNIVRRANDAATYASGIMGINGADEATVKQADLEIARFNLEQNGLTLKSKNATIDTSLGGFQI